MPARMIDTIGKEQYFHTNETTQTFNPTPSAPSHEIPKLL
ncbi:MAG: hypothetical protein RL150_2 [Candidatus Parcubacteria bacterium]|jgi:hypothetical protein